MTTANAGCLQPERKSRTGLLLVLCVAFGGLSGCAAPAIGALTVGQVLTIAGISSTIMTGRDLGEHALSTLTGKDCRFLESVLRAGRSFCEEHGAPETAGDFRGIVAFLEDSDGKRRETQVAAATLDPQLLGFAPVDRFAAHEFSLEIAREAARGEMRGTISFGMMSATFGQSFDYVLETGKQPGSAKLAEAPAPTDGRANPRF